jgi:hypothetical protein
MTAVETGGDLSLNSIVQRGLDKASSKPKAQRLKGSTDGSRN